MTQKKRNTLAYIKRNAGNYHLVPEKYKKDFDITLEAVKFSGYNLFHSHTSLHQDKRLIIAALKAEGNMDIIEHFDDAVMEQVHNYIFKHESRFTGSHYENVLQALMDLQEYETNLKQEKQIKKMFKDKKLNDINNIGKISNNNLDATILQKVDTQIKKAGKMKL